MIEITIEGKKHITKNKISALPFTPRYMWMTFDPLFPGEYMTEIDGMIFKPMCHGPIDEGPYYDGQIVNMSFWFE